MTNSKITYHFSNKLWRNADDGGWYFVSLPKNMSAEIREHLGDLEEGWGRLKVIAIMDDLKWDTAIWFDTGKSTYLLPMKGEIRKKAHLEIGQLLEIELKL